MKIVHFSDWHGRVRNLPRGDVYVCTGDMLPNSRAWRWVDKGPEQQFQKGWLESAAAQQFDILPQGAQLIAVRGNHDFIDLRRLWRGTHAVHELVKPEVVKIRGLRFGGFRGVLTIDGEQSDEMGERGIEAALQALGPVDVLVTHGPPAGILDNGFGSKALREYVDKYGGYSGGPLRAHLFGHIHESAGKLEKAGVFCSNAAMTVQEFEL